MSSGVLDVDCAADGSVYVAANDSYHSLVIYHLDASFRSMDRHEISLPHFNFRGELMRNVRRPAPSGCSLAVMRDNKCGLFVHDDQTLYVLDLAQNRQSLILLPLETFREAERANLPGRGPGLWLERQNVCMVGDLAATLGVLVFFRKGSSRVIVVNLSLDTLTVLALPDGVFVDALHVLSPSLWMFISGKSQVVFERSVESVEEAKNDMFFLHAQGERIVSRSEVAMDSMLQHIAAEPVAGRMMDDVDDEGLDGRITFQAMAYDAFFLDRAQRTHVTAFGEQTKRLHAELRYMAASPMMAGRIQMIQGASAGRRCLLSKGTVAQVVEGLEETFDYQRDEAATLRSYLRTASTASMAFNEEIFADAAYVGSSSQLCSITLRDERQPNTRPLKTKGYYGFGYEALLEVADFGRHELRQINVALPDTSYTRPRLFADPDEEENKPRGVGETVQDYDTG